MFKVISQYPVTFKEKLNLGFRLLRKQGIVAKQNYACCGSCGHYELSEDHPGKPYVFYHKQETESVFRPHRGQPPAKVLHLQWSNTVADGRKMVDALRNAGLTVEWDGTTRQSIQIQVEI